MRGMELAYREDNARSAADRWRLMAEPLLLGLVLLTAGTLALHLVGLLPLSWALLGGVGLGVCLALAQVLWADEVRASRVLLALIVPPVAVLPASVLATRFLAHRGFASLVLTLAALALLNSAWYHAHPLAFWREWLLCADWLTPATRHAFWDRWQARDEYATRAPMKMARNGIFALLVVGCVVGLGGSSARLAALALFAVGLFFTDFRPWRVARALQRILAYAFTYTGQESGAAGVFRPAASLRQRVWFAGLTLALLHLALSTGLTLYLPTQLVVPPPVVAAPVPSPPVKKATPTGRKRPAPSPSPSASLPALPAPTMPSQWLAETPDTYAGVRAFLRATWQAQTLSFQGVFDFILFPLLCAVVLPHLLLLAALRGFCLEADEIEAFLTDLDDPAGRTEWQWRVDRLQGSLHTAMDAAGNPIQEGQHLFLGDEYGRRFAVLIPQEMLRGHGYICGTTGGNKTSVGITGILLQVMVRRVPVIILDPKGDAALRETVQAQAAARGQKFRLFTPERLKATHHFLPFATLQKEWRSPIQLCQLVLEALGLAYGHGYGRGYFSGVARSALFQALQHPSHPQSFADLYRIVKQLQRGRALEDCLELLQMLETLAQYPQLGPSDQPDQMIDFNRVLEEREVVYFWLPMAEPLASAEIARLAIFSLFAAALDRQRAGLPTQETYLVIDEFQRIIARNLDVILQQARSAGIAALLANQSLQDLKTPDADLRSLIKTCTRVQLYFSVTDYEARLLSEMAGKEVVWMKSIGESRTRLKFRRQRSRTISYLESRQEVLPVDQILRVSSDPQGMIACFGIEGGYARYGGRPVLVRTFYPLSQALYTARLQASWPEDEAGAMAANATPVPPAPAAPLAEEPSSVAAAMDALLAALPAVRPRAPGART